MAPGRRDGKPETPQLALDQGEDLGPGGLAARSGDEGLLAESRPQGLLLAQIVDPAIVGLEPLPGVGRAHAHPPLEGFTSAVGGGEERVTDDGTESQGHPLQTALPMDRGRDAAAEIVEQLMAGGARASPWCPTSDSCAPRRGF